MIAACPTCGARYRIDVSKLRPEGARLRCARCEAVFRVRPPNEPEPVRAPAGPPPAMTFDDNEAPVAPRARAVAPPVAAPQRALLAASEPPAAPREIPRNRERLVLIADSQPEAGKAVAAAVTSWGCETLLVHDGVEAILNVQRALPRVVVLDAALPKMFGFQVCELIKRNESLRDIHVVLVGAIHHQTRYRRPPGDLYGADVYVERHELPGALVPLLESFGVLPRGAVTSEPPRRAPEPEPELVRPASEPPPRRAPSLAPERTQPAPTTTRPPAPAATRPPAPAATRPPTPRTGGGDPLDEARAQAERLARIIVSDIVLYNAAKFEAGVRSGDVISALGSELDEGRALFAARIDPRVGAADEFLQRELLRVARTRGMDG